MSGESASCFLFQILEFINIQCNRYIKEFATAFLLGAGLLISSFGSQKHIMHIVYFSVVRDVFR